LDRVRSKICGSRWVGSVGYWVVHFCAFICNCAYICTSALVANNRVGLYYSSTQKHRQSVTYAMKNAAGTRHTIPMATHAIPWCMFAILAPLDPQKSLE